MDLKFEFSDKQIENKRRLPEEFKPVATQIRRDIIKSLVWAGSGHTGGPLGITDVMSVMYFGGFMNYKPEDPAWKGRDRFVFSAGHMCPVLYAILARAGFFPAEELKTLRKFGSRLQGHPGLDMELPGIESSTGSLGQGISIAVGMAMSDKLIDKNSQKVFCITGDGEMEEGAVWEAAMAAGNYKLDNLCWIIDNNDCQIDGRVKDVMSIYPIDKKMEAFGFDVIVIDGHNYVQIIDAFDKFEVNAKNNNGKPTCIIAETKMGRGVSFMEDKYQWHGIPPKPEEAVKALEELVLMLIFKFTMEKLFKYSIITLIMVLFSSCETRENELSEAKNPDSVNTQELGPEIKKGIDSKTLLNFIPHELPGYKTSSPVIGTSSYDNQIVTHASREFEHFDGGFLKIAIKDFGGGEVLTKDYYNEREMLPNFVYFKISVPGGKGYKIWNNKTRSGEARVLIKERIDLFFDAHRLPNDITTFDQVVDYIDYNLLIKEIN